MNLFKKIVACGLALSLSLSGVYANQANPAEPAKKQLSTTKKIIAGISAIGGIGLLTGIGTTVAHHLANKLNVLIISDNDESRKKFIEEIKKPNIAITDILKLELKNDGRYWLALEAHSAKTSNWHIHECGLHDPNLIQQISKARVVIPLLSSQASVEELNNTLMMLVPNPYGRHIITFLDSSTFTPETFNSHSGMKDEKDMTILECTKIYGWNSNTGFLDFWAHSHYSLTDADLDYFYSQRKLKTPFAEENAQWNKRIIEYLSRCHPYMLQIPPYNSLF